jgi:hypothetical protein
MLKGEQTYLDLDALVRRLLLFDQYIMVSDNFREIAVLIAMSGLDATSELLKSNVLRIVAEPITTAQVGNLAGGTLRPDKGVLPPMSFAFARVRIADRHKFIHQAMEKHIDTLNLPLKARIRLKQDIIRATQVVEATFGELTLAQLKADMLSDAPLIKKSLALTLQVERQLEVDEKSLKVRIHQLDEEDFRVETNLEALLGFGIDAQHRLVERALLGVAGLNQRIEEMRTYNALSGFQDKELPLFEAKLDFLNHQISASVGEKRFQRVVGLNNMPAPNSVKGIDLHRLLEVRDSTECIEFRRWLDTVDELEDREVKERLESLNAKLGAAFSSIEGRLVRFLTVTAVGFVPLAGPATATLAGALDAFVLDRIFKKSGPAFFVNNLYPSIFRP